VKYTNKCLQGIGGTSLGAKPSSTQPVKGFPNLKTVPSKLTTTTAGGAGSSVEPTVKVIKKQFVFGNSGHR